jgi:uncharacterized damage-inducible protein DinB
VSPLRKLVDHCVWANRAWLQHLVEAGAPDEWLTRRLSHILLGERAWFQRIDGEAPGRDIWTQLPIPDLEEMSERHEKTFARLLSGDVARPVPFVRFTGERGTSSVEDILLHLTLHGAHHRGQMATYCSANGLTPINTDFIQYCLIVTR